MNLRQLLETTYRRRDWLFRRLTARKLWNLGVASLDFALKREQVSAKPAFVKIDISPICNLRCTVCVHADPNGSALLEKQVFAPEHKMSPEQFQRVIDAVKDTATAVSLYTWGDPMTHPDLPRLCRIAADAGLQVHVSTNYSFKLSDARVRELVNSGLTHLTVCVDGLSQEKYEKTRVGGRIAWVLDNLERTLKLRDAKSPLVEVQFIKYQHNLDEVDAARALCERLGVDQFSSFWGALHNYADREPDQYAIRGPKKNRALPGCFWPHFSIVVKWNGDVIPCCEHRMAAQHAPGADARVFGNVFETPLLEIWNGAHYQASRRLVSNPERASAEPALKKNFCDGCFVIFETGIDETSGKWADRVRWEEVYDPAKSRPGHPVRRPRAQTGLPYGPDDAPKG
jgi:MoaA/NifB/PqqE/SkfB family radical SAM enzyme